MIVVGQITNLENDMIEIKIIPKIIIFILILHIKGFLKIFQ